MPTLNLNKPSMIIIKLRNKPPGAMTDEQLAFMWTRDPEAGCRRALAEAPAFGFDAVSAYAAVIANDNVPAYLRGY